MKKRITITLLFILALVGGGLAYKSQQTAIVKYDVERDYDSMLKVFQDNLYWMSTWKYCPEDFLKYEIINCNMNTKKQMHMYVQRFEGKTVGLVAFYVKPHTRGLNWYLNFLMVEKSFRGKGFGHSLHKFAIEKLKMLGAKKVDLTTRLSNTSARKLYEGLNFKEVSKDEARGLINYEFTF